MKVLPALILLLPALAHANTAFDFLIGEHDVTLHAWTGSGWTPPRPVNAEWHGRKALRDEVIQDEWFDPNPNSPSSIYSLQSTTRPFDDPSRDPSPCLTLL